MKTSTYNLDKRLESTFGSSCVIFRTHLSQGIYSLAASIFSRNNKQGLSAEKYSRKMIDEDRVDRREISCNDDDDPE
jgi:hypothetical protein